MADQIVLSPNKSSSLRRNRAKTSNAWADTWLQAKLEGHALQGQTPDGLHQYRSLMQFDLSKTALAGVQQITSAYLHVFTATDHAGFVPDVIKSTATHQLLVAMKNTAWSEAGGGEAVWTGALANGGADYGSSRRTAAWVDNTNLRETVLNVMGAVAYWAPTTILDNTGKTKCLGKPNNGFVLDAYTSLNYQTSLASAHHVNTAIHPFLVLGVVLAGGPGDVVLGGPNGDIPVGTPQFFTGEYEPGRPDDNMKTVCIKYTPSGKPSVEFSWTATNDEIATSTFSVPVPASLLLATPYAWTAQVTNSRAETTPYSAPPLTVRWVGTPPVLTAPQPSAVTLDNLISVPFSVEVDVPASHYRATQWRIQLRPRTASSDPTWDSNLLWDTGLMTVPLSADEMKPVGTAIKQMLSTLYGGPTLDPGDYSWRVLATDQYGATSPWLYSDLTVNAAYVPQPGVDVNLTGYAKTPPFRIRIYGMGALRGPGVLLAELTDASNVGASEFYNTAGEFFFTLPVTHPQAAVIEPYETHYSLDIHTEEGWRPKAFGLITDFDANENEVVFYGTDYLGLLSRAVEERFDPTNADLPTDKGGAKYVNQTITAIITDQLTKAKAIANSPVGFITIGDIANLPEKTTIYASFRQRLPFISGLIESAKAGTGRKTRLVCERAANGTFRWRLLYDPGLVRDNIRLEYGGIIDGFRAVPYTGWGTSVAAVGRTALGTKVYSAIAVATGVDETKMGHWPSNASYADLDDLNDLRRRTAQAANKIAKVGKRMGLALRVNALALKDGWDITDTLPVLIQRGVVDTYRWGGVEDPVTPANNKFAYWTVWGWTWNGYPDGHASMVLSLLPSESNKASDPNLIPSKPIFSSREWQTGYGIPTTWSVPPQPTPPPAGLFAATEDVGVEAQTTTYPLSDDPISAQNYQDLNTGCIYELDQDDTSPTYLQYEQVYCPPAATGGGGSPPDTTPPSVPVIKSATSTSTTQTDGTSITNIVAQVGYATAPVGLTDLDQISLQSTRYALPADATQPDWTLATQWLTTSADRIGSVDTTVIQPSVLSATKYWLRAAAIDQFGNRSGWSPTVTVTTAVDAVGPPQPTGVTLTPGNTNFGIYWDPIEVADLAYVEVQYGVHPATSWVSVHVPGTIAVVTGLVNGTQYDVRVRSIDTSGNTQNADGSSVIAADDGTAGWVPTQTVTPSGIPATSLVWTDAMIQSLFAGKINADWITAGTLKVGGTGNAAGITVYDATGHLVGRWTSAGIEVFDPANPGYKMVITAAGLTIYTGADTANPVAVVTMSPLGIDAASITFGSARGGHNLVQNSSFELGRFGVANIVNSVWDLAADFNATRQGADTNLTQSASTLTMTVI